MVAIPGANSSFLSRLPEEDRQAIKKSGGAFDATLRAQQETTPRPPTTSAPREHVKPERAQDPSDQKFYNMAADRQNRTIDLENRRDSLSRDIDILGTSGGYASEVMRAELKQVEADLGIAPPISQTAATNGAEKPEVYGPPAPAEHRLQQAANQYAELDNFIGPLLPGTREGLEADIRQAANDLGLDPDRVVADLNRDLAFRNYQPNGFDFRADVVDIPHTEWATAIGPHPEGQGIYYGGGAVQGPDGQLYPLVIPTVGQGDTRYNADRSAPIPSYDGSEGRSAENHLGEDTGWTTLGLEGGPARFGDKPSGWDRFFAFWAGTANYQPIDGQPLRAEGYQALQVSETGYPSLLTGNEPSPAAGPPTTMPGDPPRTHYILVEGRLTAVDPTQLDGYNRATRRAAARNGITPPASTRIGAVNAGTDLAVIAGQGVVSALRLDDGNTGYYQLVFQESDDGGRRAMLRAYSMTSQNGQVNIWPTYVTLDQNGELEGTPIRFRPPDEGSIEPIPDYNVVQLNP